jgi:hypothetical protein
MDPFWDGRIVVMMGLVRSSIEGKEEGQILNPLNWGHYRFNLGNYGSRYLFDVFVYTLNHNEQ